MLTIYVGTDPINFSSVFYSMPLRMGNKIENGFFLLSKFLRYFYLSKHFPNYKNVNNCSHLFNLSLTSFSFIFKFIIFKVIVVDFYKFDVYKFEIYKFDVYKFEIYKFDVSEFDLVNPPFPFQSDMHQFPIFLPETKILYFEKRKKNQKAK